MRRSKEWGSIGFKLRSDRWVLVEYMEAKCAREGEAFYVESMLDSLPTKTNLVKRRVWNRFVIYVAELKRTRTMLCGAVKHLNRDGIETFIG